MMSLRCVGPICPATPWLPTAALSVNSIHTNERKKGKSVNIVEDDDLSEIFFAGMVNCETEQKEVNAIRKDKWIAQLMINGTIITMKLDTGAKANLMSLSDIKAMKDKPQI